MGSIAAMVLVVPQICDRPRNRRPREIGVEPEKQCPQLSHRCRHMFCTASPVALPTR
jgi:hypothetical protein